MRIQSVTPNFKANLDQGFVNNAQAYYLKRGLGLQNDRFMRQCDKFDMYGSEDTLFFYRYVENDPDRLPHQLCIKNKRINKHTGAIVKKFKNYCHALEYFIAITDNNVLKWEDDLETLKKNPNLLPDK